MAGRIVRMGKGKSSPYDGLVRLTSDGEARWTGRVTFDVAKLAEPLSWRKPKRVFVNSMSDLFHESLTNEQIAALFGVMAATPHVTYVVLTKRARRMREWFEWAHAGAFDRVVCHADDALKAARPADRLVFAALAWAGRGGRPSTWPLSNVWLGVSVENQDAADERIPDLLATPAAVRFLSCEPLLGPIDVIGRLDPGRCDCDVCLRTSVRCTASRHPIDQVIVGCESGPGARPTESAWYRSLRDQCAECGVAFFLKQAREEGTWVGDNEHEQTVLCGPGSTRKPRGIIGAPYLDGVQYLEMPEL